MIRPSLLAAGLLLASGFAVSADPAGNWITPESKSRVRIVDCGGGLCATIVWLREPNDASGQPKLDAKNADAGKRGQPIIGVSLLRGMKPEGDQWRGQIYNPEDGKTYTAYMTAQGANTLKIQGCALGGLLCRTQIWKRAN